MRADVLAVVAAMAAVTLLTRLAGLWAGRGPLRRSLTTNAGARLLAHLPGAVLVSIIAPTVVRGGVADGLAAAVTMLVFLRTRSALAAVAVAVVSAAVSRRVLGT